MPGRKVGFPRPIIDKIDNNEFTAGSAIRNVIPLRIQLKDFMEEQAKINKDTHSKFKAVDKVLESIDGKITTVGSSNQQLMGMMKILENQLSRLASISQTKMKESCRDSHGLKSHSKRSLADPGERLETRVDYKNCRFGGSERKRVKTNRSDDVDDTRVLPGKCRVRASKTDEHFNKFIEVIKQLYIHMSLLDALQVPTYAKYFKDILANKREMPSECVKPTTECSAAIMDVPLRKMADPGCPTIPCSIGVLNIDKALCDLGASVSVMPKSVFDRLKLPKPEPTSMCPELADRSPVFRERRARVVVLERKSLEDEESGKLHQEDFQGFFIKEQLSTPRRRFIKTFIKETLVSEMGSSGSSESPSGSRIERMFFSLLC
ncbi:hypothetical protein U9M48_011912 [Paspalum notatum var. saurae]|uniref:Uncharacterized protein n=1 Tax=Paspalum notatum var. saurae TaxID=547442 RepID=A0AAQ3SWG8_PASNO